MASGTSDTSARKDAGASAVAAVVVASSGTAYTRKGLVDQVQTLLAAPPSAASGKPRSGLGRPAALQGCLEALGATTMPLAVDVATFERKPAAIVVLPATTGEGREVWVVARTCRPGADGTLYYTRLP